MMIHFNEIIILIELILKMGNQVDPKVDIDIESVGVPLIVFICISKPNPYWKIIKEGKTKTLV